MLRATALSLICAYTLLGQDRVPEQYLHERIMAIVPMIGQGTAEDPIRPMFVPRPSETSSFLSIQYELSDDGKTALVEFVARDKAAFKDILAARSETVKIFERNKNVKEDVEREFSQMKRDYKFHVPGKDVPQAARDQQ